MGCLAVSLTIYFTYYRIQKKTNDKNPLDDSSPVVQSKIMRMIPSTGYSLLLIPIKLIYKKLATFLTDFGMKNYRLFSKEKIFVFITNRKSSSTNSL